MSDGSAYGGTLTTSNPFFRISGLNVVLAVSPSPTQDGTTETTVISAP
jgi:hypothetical protein